MDKWYLPVNVNNGTHLDKWKMDITCGYDQGLFQPVDVGWWVGSYNTPDLKKMVMMVMMKVMVMKMVMKMMVMKMMDCDIPEQA